MSLEPVHADHGGRWADGRLHGCGHLQEDSATEEGADKVDADANADAAASPEAVDALAAAAHVPAAEGPAQAA